MGQRHLETAILSAIAEESPLHVMDLATDIDAHPVTVDRMCAQLHENGYIRPSTRGRYTLTDDGRQRFADSN